jgi:hypothetical protein
MKRLSKEEKIKILNSSPIGTWALMLIVGIGMMLGWLFFYYGVFMPRGMVN